MPSRSAAVLDALAVALGPFLPVGAKLLRNSTLPKRIPAAGIVILRDGDPGEPEVTLSPATYIYEHRADLEVVVDLATPALREAAFDSLKVAIGNAIAANRTLGGLCDYVLGEAPAPVDLPVDGADGMKAAVIGVILTYGSPDPLT
jgi:hypothetical protein